MRASEQKKINQEDYQELMKICQQCDASPHTSEWEKDFCADLKERLTKYKATTMVSVKQWGVIERIMDKL